MLRLLLLYCQWIPVLPPSPGPPSYIIEQPLCGIAELRTFCYFIPPRTGQGPI